MTPALALENEQTRLEPDYFFRRQAHRWTPPVQTAIKHISATCRQVARSLPGGAFAINLTEPDYFALRWYSLHLRPTLIPERASWDNNHPSAAVKKTMKKLLESSGRRPQPPGLPSGLETDPLGPEQIPDYNAIQGIEGTRRLLLLQHNLERSLIEVGALKPPTNPQKYYKPHLTVGSCKTTQWHLEPIWRSLQRLVQPRRLTDQDLPRDTALINSNSNSDSNQPTNHHHHHHQKGAPAFPVARIALLIKADHDTGP